MKGENKGRKFLVMFDKEQEEEKKSERKKREFV